MNISAKVLFASSILFSVCCSASARNNSNNKEAKTEQAASANSCTLTVSTGSIKNCTCNGAANGSTTAYPSGGTAPYTYSWSPTGGTGSTASGITAGTYTVTVTDAAGCTATAKATVFQPTQLVVTINNDTAFHGCNGAAWVTVSGGTTPYTYAWGTGGTSFKIDSLCGGTYCCLVTDAQGCKGGPDSVCTAVVLEGLTSVNELKNNNTSIKVFPSPNNGQFTLNTPNAPGIVEIYNMLGEVVYQEPIQQGNNSINLNAKPSGVYLYKALTLKGDLLGIGKFVIDR